MNKLIVKTYLYMNTYTYIYIYIYMNKYIHGHAPSKKVEPRASQNEPKDRQQVHRWKSTHLLQISVNAGLGQCWMRDWDNVGSAKDGPLTGFGHHPAEATFLQLEFVRDQFKIPRRSHKGIRNKQNGPKRGAKTSQGSFKDTLAEHDRTNIEKVCQKMQTRVPIFEPKSIKT